MLREAVARETIHLLRGLRLLLVLRLVLDASAGLAFDKSKEVVSSDSQPSSFSAPDAGW